MRLNSCHFLQKCCYFFCFYSQNLIPIIEKEAMKKIKITQVKSTIDRPERQKRSMQALGLRKMHQTVEHNPTPQILGIVEKVKHLISVEEIG
jgi:large subunit ribosomal protein L30